jgi:hypothetical protein
MANNQVVVQANANLRLSTILAIIDSSNSTVAAGSTTWGLGTSVTVTAPAVVQAGGALTLNIQDLDGLHGLGNSIVVEQGGSLTLGTETVVGVDGRPYKLNARV